MKIQVTLRCVCGASLEEIEDVECEKEHENITSHRHGKCPACDHPMICVCERVPPHVHTEYN